MLPVKKELFGRKKIWSRIHKILCYINVLTIIATLLQLIPLYIANIAWISSVDKVTDQASAVIFISLFYVQKSDYIL